MKSPLIIKSIAAALIFAVSACATSEGYGILLDDWVGHSERKLITSWGAPDSVYESDGYKYLTYSKSRSVNIPGIAPSYQTQIIGNTAYTRQYGGSSGFTYNGSCKTTFIIGSDGIIDAWNFEGNDCRA
jgi:hypothetical protein